MWSIGPSLADMQAQSFTLPSLECIGYVLTA